MDFIWEGLTLCVLIAAGKVYWQVARKSKGLDWLVNSWNRKMKLPVIQFDVLQKKTSFWTDRLTRFIPTLRSCSQYLIKALSDYRADVSLAIDEYWFLIFFLFFDSPTYPRVRSNFMMDAQRCRLTEWIKKRNDFISRCARIQIQINFETEQQQWERGKFSWNLILFLN